MRKNTKIPKHKQTIGSNTKQRKTGARSYLRVWAPRRQEHKNMYLYLVQLKTIHQLQVDSRFSKPDLKPTNLELDSQTLAARFLSVFPLDQDHVLDLTTLKLILIYLSHFSFKVEVKWNENETKI